MERFWTQDKISALTDLWAAGTPTKLIGASLGCSKMAAIGKATRIGLPIHADSHKSERHRQKTRERISSPRRRNNADKSLEQIFRKRRPAPPPTIALPPPVAIAPLNISFADLGPRQCKYAVTAGPPHFFCGHVRKKDSPYCAFHHSICYYKTELQRARAA